MSPTQLITYPQSPQVNPALGEVVRVRTPWFPIVWHYGVVVGHNFLVQGLVIHCSMRVGSVAIETLDDFAQRGTVEIFGFPGELPAWQVVTRAKSQLGKPWHPTEFNCEHFWMEAHGLRPQSPQLQVAMFLGTIGLACALLHDAS